MRRSQRCRLAGSAEVLRRPLRPQPVRSAPETALFNRPSSACARRTGAWSVSSRPMQPSAARTVTWNGQRARLEHSSTPAPRQQGAIIPVAGSGPLAVSLVQHCVEQLATMGLAEISTPAMSESETAGFLRAGFSVSARLHLLSHDLGDIPDPTTSSPPTMRRGPNDTALLLSVDHAAFRADWRMDEHAISGAATATPSVRIRTTGPRETPVAFAITGRAGRRGYLQRLAVDPSVHRQGHGRALVADALRWCRRWRSRRVVVNTQEGNEPALSLYEAMGFERADKGLVVLRLSLDGATDDRSGFAS